MPVIEISQLSYAYPALLPEGQPVQVLHDLDLTVERGEVLAIMGPTGAGKSTLCLALNGLVPNATGGIYGGHVQVLGHDTRNTPVSELARHVSIVYQDPDSQLFCANVEDEVAFGPENLAVDPREIAERVAWALAVVDMSAHRLRSPAALSGGQKQRVAIAAGLAMLPEVLVLDEPTSGLDPDGQFEVWSAIQRLGRERSMTIVMVSQDAEQVAEFAGRVAVLDQGRLLCVNTPERVFANHALLSAAGLAAPQVAEVAEALNARHGSAFHFVRLDLAEAALRNALSMPPTAGGPPA
jgi:energy-coupling factor transport system ATP-binding protein